MRSICALVCARSLAVRRREMAHHARDAQARQTHHLADRVDLLGEESASPHSGVDIEMDVDGPAAPHSSRRQVSRRLPAAHLFLNVELPNRLLHFRFERHSEPEQGNFQPEAGESSPLPDWCKCRACRRQLRTATGASASSP